MAAFEIAALGVIVAAVLYATVLWLSNRMAAVQVQSAEDLPSWLEGSK